MDDDAIVVTTETIFYAQGGGQPCDTGTMHSETSENPATFLVSSVRNGSGGRILHLGQFRPSQKNTFFEGDSVFQVLDADRRETNSRIHTGGHVIGLAVRHLAESIPGITELKAQHYPDSAFVEFQGLIDGKHKDIIQAKAESFIQRAMPVKVYFWNEEELREKCVIVPAAVVISPGNLIRAVDIEGAGAYPCGGTHVVDTSRVGNLQVKKISRSKGISKISYTVSWPGSVDP